MSELKDGDVAAVGMNLFFVGVFCQWHSPFRLGAKLEKEERRKKSEKNKKNDRKDDTNKKSSYEEDCIMISVLRRVG